MMKRRSSLCMIAGTALSMLLPLASNAADIGWLVQDQLSRDGRADVFVKMRNDANLDGAAGILSRIDRAQSVRDTLTAHADADQRAIRALLAQRGADFRVFWINNSLFVRDADRALVDALAARTDVAYIRGNHTVPLHLPEQGNDTHAAIDDIEWNIDIVNAPDAWSAGFTGDGIVLANIDTGVRYTHEALVDSYRGNNGGGSFTHDYNWFDPTGICGATPCDNNNHGSHTMGTMIGGDGFGPFDNDIGVAPDAAWIAAKGCETNSCSDFALISSAEWIACPTDVNGNNPDCSKVPHVVNNSWSGGGGDPWYVSYVRAWIQAGIVPVFSLGNSGPSCSTANSPGDYPNVLGIGATHITDALASFSSRGPGSFRPLKPDFVAPGDSVRSAFASSDTSYGIFSGTSMAAPNVAATIGLMLQANPNATLGNLYAALRGTAVQTLGAPISPPNACAGRPYDVYPNLLHGWGRIDAGAAVIAVQP